MKKSVGTLLILFLVWVSFGGCANVSSPSNVSAQDLQKIQAQAEMGDAKAQTTLGSLYSNGQGVSQNYETARQWFEKAAAQGDSTAQNWLGGLYQEGLGVPQDYAKAYEWYERSAIQGNAVAQYNLGWLYAHGKGTKQDFLRAYIWFHLSATGLPIGKAQETAARNRDAVALHMTPAQIAEAKKLSQQCQAREFKGC